MLLTKIASGKISNRLDFAEDFVMVRYQTILLIYRI